MHHRAVSAIPLPHRARPHPSSIFFLPDSPNEVSSGLAQASSHFSSFCQPLLLAFVLGRFLSTLYKLGSSEKRDTQLGSCCLSDWPVDKPVRHFLDCKIDVEEQSCCLWAVPHLGNLEYARKQTEQTGG